MKRPQFVLQVPVISTAHMPNEDAVNEYDMLAASYEGGWFVFIDDDLEEDVPEWYAAVCRWAKLFDYNWVRFDSDGDVIDELPKYKW